MENLQGGCAGRVSPSWLEARNINTRPYSACFHTSTQHQETATLLNPASFCSHLKQPALGYTHHGMSYTYSQTNVCVCVVAVGRGGGTGPDPSHPNERITSAPKGCLLRCSLQSESICYMMVGDLEASLKSQETDLFI